LLYLNIYKLAERATTCDFTKVKAQVVERIESDFRLNPCAKTIMKSVILLK